MVCSLGRSPGSEVFGTSAHPSGAKEAGELGLSLLQGSVSHLLHRAKMSDPSPPTPRTSPFLFCAVVVGLSQRH